MHGSDALSDEIGFRNSQGLEVVGLGRHISRSSIAFDVYTPFSVVQLSEKLTDLVIRRGRRRIYQGNAVVTDLVNTGSGIVVSATLTDPWQDLQGLIQEHPNGVQREAERFLSDWESSFELREDVQLSVTRIRSLLYQLSRWVEQVDLYIEEVNAKDGDETVESVIQSISSPIIPALYDNIQKFEYAVKQIDDDSKAKHRAFIQRDIHPLIMRSPFVHRTFMKPLGYAGDYEMVNMMLRSPFEGGSTYHKIVNSLFLNAQPVVAHQNRIEVLESYLDHFAKLALREKRKVKVCNLGCGPAIEVQRMVSKGLLNDYFEITLMDFNQETLDYTQSQIGKANDKFKADLSGIKFVKRSVDSILRERSTLNSTAGFEFDFVYCAGLFDYLSDRVCSRMLRIFFNWVKPGGTVLATNVHKRHDSRGIMEYLMDWHLEYRDEKEFDALFDAQGVAEKRTYTDDSNVNIFLDISKNNEKK